MRIVKTIGGDLYMVTSSSGFVNLNTGEVCSSIDIIDSVYKISIQEIIKKRRFQENTILYNPSLDHYAIGKREMLDGFDIKALYANNLPRNLYGFAGKSYGWRIATQEEISLLHKSLSKINWTVENDKFVKIITKAEISEKFGLNFAEIKIV